MRYCFSILALAGAALALASCQTVDAQGGAPLAAQSAPIAPTAPPPLVQNACAKCHGVEKPFLSPNPHAPGFDAIANSRGLTRESLTHWLANAHNYPEVMDFAVEQDHVGQIADYMLTLRSEDYVPEQ